MNIVHDLTFENKSMKIIIDWKKIKKEEDFYNTFLDQVKAPKWHGKNLDALADSIITGSINFIEPPYTIHNINTSDISEYISEFQLKVLNIFSEGVTENRGIKLLIE